ncbi:hypothetical protein [Brevundimonas sp. GCM10030266]|uniref:hypothetical protein n=1 Tax=Brevundimonas sp. GCM10030266 TaxID=3273386 RepID=UPI00361D0711
MIQTLSRLRWPLYGGYLLLTVLALMMAFTPGLELLGLPPERVTFTPATVTGLPWSLPVVVARFDSVTTLAIVMVANLLNVAIGLMLVKSGD